MHSMSFLTENLETLKRKWLDKFTSKDQTFNRSEIYNINNFLSERREKKC